MKHIRQKKIYNKPLYSLFFKEAVKWNNTHQSFWGFFPPRLSSRWRTIDQDLPVPRALQRQQPPQRWQQRWSDICWSRARRSRMFPPVHRAATSDAWTRSRNRSVARTLSPPGCTGKERASYGTAWVARKGSACATLDLRPHWCLCKRPTIETLGGGLSLVERKCF